jgi:hypothetical protein
MAEQRTAWTIEDVAARFVDAAQTARRLPNTNPQGHFNPWMTLAMHIPDRYPDPQRAYRLPPPGPQAIERMLETMRWVQWLEVEQRHLVWMRAHRHGWRDITARFACDRTTAWRRWQRAMEAVAARLNGGGV